MICKPVSGLPSNTAILMLILSSCLITSCASVGISSDLLRVRSIEALAATVATAKPGTTIELARGEYNLKRRLTLSARGTRENPIRIRAEDKAVHLTGAGSLNIEKSSWLVFEGFILRYEAAPLSITDSNNVRLTALSFLYSPRPNRPDTRIHWVHFRDGDGHRLDYSDLGPHSGGLGVTVLVENAVRGVRIDHNHFHDRPRDGRNGAETIRLGSGGRATIAAIIEQNLFENCNGEAEIISIKSNGVVVRNNTFIDNHGQLVVRAGNDILIEGNHFIATTPRLPVGGIRVHGEKVRIVNNYFQNLPTPVLESFAGEQRVSVATDNKPGAAGFESGYRQAFDVHFVGNLIVDDEPPEPSSLRRNSPALVDLGDQRKAARTATLRPERWFIANNLFITQRPMIVDRDGVDFVWQANIQSRVASPSHQTMEKVDCEEERPDVRRNDPWRVKEPWLLTCHPGFISLVDGEEMSSSVSLPWPLAPEQVGPGARK